MCKETFNTTEYKQWRQYIEDTGDNVCKCEFKKILKRQKEIKKYQELEKEEWNEKINKEIEFYKSLEKKSLFQELKEKFNLFNFKRNFRKASYCGNRIYNLIVKK